MYLQIFLRMDIIKERRNVFLNGTIGKTNGITKNMV